MSIARFLSRAGVRTTTGATDAQIRAFEGETGLALPADVRRLYAASNGLDVEWRGHMRVYSLAEAADLVRFMHQFGITDLWGYFPFTDFNDSNPHCVCCAGPVRGYVVRVFHDDVAQIEYRNLATFLASVEQVLDSDEGETGENSASLYELPRDLYPDTIDRTPADIEIGHQLLALAATLAEGSVERADAERWAVTLFSDDEVDEVARLLDEGDQYRRREAIAKLTAMTTPRAQAAVRQHRREMSEFIRQAVHAIRQAGIEVAEINDNCPRLEPGRVWFDVPAYFHRRRAPTVLADMVRRAQELIEYKTRATP
jgi:hypothetical protein